VREKRAAFERKSLVLLIIVFTIAGGEAILEIRAVQTSILDRRLAPPDAARATGPKTISQFLIFRKRFFAALEIRDFSSMIPAFARSAPGWPYHQGLIALR
jgi:hypothetical protein